MSKLDEKTKESLRNLTTLVVLDLRAAYLANGASPLKHWDQMLDRMRSATRTTSSVEEWHTAVSRGLQLGAPSSAACSTLSELVATVGPFRSEWLDLVERESGYVIALARLEAEKRRDVRDAKAAMELTRLEGE